jgi:polyphosphate kinase
VGTGNLNEDTARLYSDFGFFTARPDFVSDVRGIFDFLISAHRRFEAKQLLAAPYFMRQGFEKLIEDEIAGAKRGEPAYIHAKCNTLTDQKMIELLYKAGRAGVEVRLIVRGACCLIPGHPELSPNIRAISIVDQFLEHARLFIFCGGGREKIFISSADWMTRNLDKRLEAAAPILSENIRKTLRDFFDLQWSDNVKARDLSELGANAYVPSPAGRRVRAQTALYYAAHNSPDKPGGSTSSEDQ